MSNIPSRHRLLAGIILSATTLVSHAASKDYKAGQPAGEAVKGRSLDISVTITNRGVAPFYAGWPGRLLAVDSAGGELVAELPFALNALLPAAAATRSVALDLAKFSSGEVTLLLGIPNPLRGGRPLRFANADQDRDRPGWLTLGKIAIP